LTLSRPRQTEDRPRATQKPPTQSSPGATQAAMVHQKTREPKEKKHTQFKRQCVTHCHIEEAQPFPWRQRDVYAIYLAKQKRPTKKKTLRKNRNKTRTKQAININNKERTKAVLGCQREKPVPKKRKRKTLKTEDPKNV